MLSRLGSNLPIMSTFFSSSSSPKDTDTESPADLNKGDTTTTGPPTLATHHALPSDTEAQFQREKSPKPSSEKERSSEKESTLVDEPIRDSTAAAEDTNKETTRDNQPPEVIPNEDSNKESVVKNDTEKEAAKEEDKNSSDGDVENTSKEPEPEYPTAFRLFLITIALCLCVFCVALVCHPLPIRTYNSWSQLLTIFLDIGQHNHCNSYSKNHRSIQLTR